VAWRLVIRQRWKQAVGGLAVVVASTSLVGAAVAGLAVWVSGGAFDWTLAAAAATAFGTTALAVATGVLARETLENVRATREDVRSTGKLVELAERDQVERDRPILVLVESGLFLEPVFVIVDEASGVRRSAGSGEATWSFLNAGVAPAFDVRFGIHYGGDDAVSVTFDQQPLHKPVVMPGEPWNETMRVSFDGPEGSTIDPARVYFLGGYKDRTLERRYDLLVLPK
jgi:hypothetical protein